MRIRWLKENQYHSELGLLEADAVLTVPNKTGAKWIKSGHAEEVKPAKKSKKEVNDG